MGQGTCSRGELLRQAGNEAPGVFGVGLHDLEDGGDVDAAVLGMPAVEVGHHGDGCIADLGLAGELGLGHVGHADDIAAPGAVEMAFGQGGELRAFHHQIGAAAMMRRPASAGKGRPTLSARPGLTGSAMETCATHPAPKKLLARAKVRSMNWSTMQKVPGGRCSRNEPQADSDTRSVTPARLQAIDIGAVVDIGGRQAMAAAVARQEHHVEAGDLADAQLRRKVRPTGCRCAASAPRPCRCHRGRSRR